MKNREQRWYVFFDHNSDVVYRTAEYYGSATKKSALNEAIRANKSEIKNECRNLNEFMEELEDTLKKKAGLARELARLAEQEAKKQKKGKNETNSRT